MGEQRVRFVEFERGEIDMETGEFPMILATDGEASDGDILSIEGAQFAERAPLQLSHINDPRATAGSVFGFRRDLQSTPKKLKARGQIEMGGDGAAADIRRDLAFMVGQGHVTGISVRWEPIEWVRRINLPSDHEAFVDAESEKDWRKRYGLYFKKWRVQEGSIVAVQADKQAMIGRAEHWESEQGPKSAVAAFYRAMAEDAKDASVFVKMPATEEEAAADPIRADKATAPAVVKPPTPEGLKAAFAAQIRELQAAGLSVDDLADVLEENRPEAPTTDDLLTRLKATQNELAAMRSQIASLEGSRVNGVPTPPLRSVAEIVNQLDAMLEQSNQKALAATRALIDKRAGRVDVAMQTYRQIAHAEVDKALNELRGDGPRDASGDALVLGSMLESMESMVEQARKKLSRLAQE